MRLVKRILFVSGLLLIVSQFIRPAHNKSEVDLNTEISNIVTMPDTVLTLIKDACYDCHSNNTDYPWYSNIEPVGWLIAYHIKQAKKELNFSDFGSYSQRRQASKLDGISNSIKDNTMPLKSYKIMHKPAKLSPNEKALLIGWAQQTRDSLSVR